SIYAWVMPFLFSCRSPMPPQRSRKAGVPRCVGLRQKARMQRGRLQSIDVYRGLAILAMVAYHLIWDLNYYGLISVGIGVDAAWFAFQRSILTAFLLLTGAGLWLGHKDGIDWRRFWRREALLVAAAVGVSL